MPDQDQQLPWEQPAWLEQASAWIHSELKQRGRSVTGPVEVLHMRPWSAFARVSTTSSVVYFKAPSPSLKFEAALTQALAGCRIFWKQRQRQGIKTTAARLSFDEQETEQ